jgi:hypothetical protein
MSAKRLKVASDLLPKRVRTSLLADVPLDASSTNWLANEWLKEFWKDFPPWSEKKKIDVEIQCALDSVARIDLSETLSCKSVVELSEWSKGITWKLEEKESTEVFSYLEQELLPMDFILNQPSSHGWYMSIPREVREKIIHFEEYQFAVLYLISHYKFALQLFLTNSTLVWLMLAHADRHNVPETKLVKLFEQPRANILHSIGLPGSKAAVKLISKLAFSSYSKDSFDEIKQILNLENFAKLNHHKELGDSTLAFVTHFPELITSPLISIDNVSLMTDIKLMAKDIGIENIISLMDKCRSYDDVHALHDNLVLRLSLLGFEEGLEYPPPPLEGNANIIPLINPKQLYDESIQQCHCVFSYHHLIKEGEYYVYSILCPERATLGIRFSNYDSRVQFDQLVLAHNEEVSENTKEYVMAWLNGESV